MRSRKGIISTANAGRRIALAFLVALVLIATGFVLSFYSYSRYGADSDRVQHTHRAINGLEYVLSSLKDIETGSRGFIASRGDSLYLETYFVAVRAIPKQLDELKTLLADNPRQRVRLDTLVQQVSTELNVASLIIQYGYDRRTLPSRLLIGKLKMDQIRRTVALMIAEEQTLMKDRNERAEASYQRTIIIVFLLSMLTFLSLIAAYNLLDEELERRQQVEDQLRDYEVELKARVQQLTTTNEELERFAFIASHDLQEPLRKIQAFAGLISDKAKLDSESNLFMTKIVSSADRMSKMIKDLLEFSRVTSHDHNFQAVKMSELIDHVLDDMELQVKGLKADIQVGWLPMLPVIPSQMEQVFANLISNALKYRKPDVLPIVRITSEPVDGQEYPGLTPNRKYFRISVSDNGIGFEEKYTDQIFKLFQRLHAKTSYDGTGIGLAVCKRIVMAHKGYITAHSKPGEGATFEVVLPEKQPLPDLERTIIYPSAVPSLPEAAPVERLLPGSGPA